MFGGVVTMKENEGLSLEQQFRQRHFETLVSQMDLDQAREFLVQLHHQMLLKDAVYLNMLRGGMLS